MANTKYHCPIHKQQLLYTIPDYPDALLCKKCLAEIYAIIDGHLCRSTGSGNQWEDVATKEIRIAKS